MSNPRRVLRALYALCLSLSLLSCGARPQPTPHAAVEARAQKPLEGHTQVVWQVAFSPDGRRLASCSVDKTVRLWSIPDGALLRELTGGSEHVYSVAFSPDGRWLASGSREKGTLGTAWKQFAPAAISGGRGQTVRLWQTSDGALQQALSEHDADVHTVAFSPDSNWLASSGYDNTIKLYALGLKRRPADDGEGD